MDCCLANITSLSSPLHTTTSTVAGDVDLVPDLVAGRKTQSGVGVESNLTWAAVPGFRYCAAPGLSASPAARED